MSAFDSVQLTNVKIGTVAAIYQIMPLSIPGQQLIENLHFNFLLYHKML
jgi:hypothetical protein